MTIYTVNFTLSTCNHIITETNRLKNWNGFPDHAITIAANGCGDHLVFLKSGTSFDSAVYLWFKKRTLHEGKEIVNWPVTDVRHDILIVDLSRLKENQVGIRERTYGVLRRKSPPSRFRYFLRS